MKKIWSIAWYTFLECVRNKVILTIFLFLLVGAACVSFFRYMTPAEEIKLVKDFCFGSISFIGIIISIFLPVTVIAREMEELTVYVILSKPVTRGEFVVAKYAGIILTLLAMMGIMSVSFLGILYLRERFLDLIVLESVLLLFCKFAVMSAIALFCAMMTTTHVLAATVSFFVYILGHLIDNLSDMVHHIDVAYTHAILSVAVKILPNLSGFDISDAVVVGTHVSTGYIAKMVIYAVIYSTATLLLTIGCFRKKQL